MTWSKLLINSVPVGATKQRGPFTPDECHHSLVAHNPSYASLQITQKPSWVRPPSTLKPDTYSSLIVAFEDPDGSACRSLLSSKQLYILGAKAKVSHWKETKRPTSKTNQQPPSLPTSSNSSHSLDDNILRLSPITQAQEPPAPPPLHPLLRVNSQGTPDKQMASRANRHIPCPHVTNSSGGPWPGTVSFIQACSPFSRMTQRWLGHGSSTAFSLLYTLSLHHVLT